MRFLLFSAAAALLATVFFSTPVSSESGMNQASSTPALCDSVAVAIAAAAMPERDQYLALRANIAAQQQLLSTQFSAATSDSARNAVRNAARAFLMAELLEHVFPAWYGTEWDYNGHTDTPRVGMVACGYFVSTPIRHCGFRVNRFRLAQQYSFSIVKTLCDNNRIQRIGNNELDRVLEYIANQPNDLYVVGLDHHVGWLAKTDDGIFFIHSNYIGPIAVERELASESDCLRSSQNFVLGHFISNEQVIDQWLLQQEIAVVP